MTGILMDKHRYVPPIAADFPTIMGSNSVDPTLTDTTGRGLLMNFGASPASGDNIRCAFKNINADANQSIIARIDTLQCNFHFSSVGLAFSDGTKVITWGMEWNTGNGGLVLSEWTNTTTRSSSPISSSDSTPGDVEWFRMDLVSGAPTAFYASGNGTDWIEFYNASLGGFLTPTLVGFHLFVNLDSGVTPVVGTNQAYLNVLYYSDPDIVPGV